MMMKIPLAIGFLLVPVLMLAALSGCIGYDEDNDGDYSKAELRYTITASNSNGEKRFILLPVPHNDGGANSPVLDKLFVANGSGSFDIVDDDYGPCIKIWFTDHITLEASGRMNQSRDMQFAFFSMVSSVGGHRWDEKEFYAYVSELNGNETVSVDIFGSSRYYWENSWECGASDQTMEISGQLDRTGWSPGLSGQLYSEDGT